MVHEVAHAAVHTQLPAVCVLCLHSCLLFLNGTLAFLCSFILLRRCDVQVVGRLLPEINDVVQ